MSTNEKPDDPGYGRRCFERLKALTEAREIPLLDKLRWIVAKGVEPSALKFKHDGHLSPLAHQITAEILLKYLEANTGICSSAERPSVLAAR
jgi:hypothetical protein